MEKAPKAEKVKTIQNKIISHGHLRLTDQEKRNATIKKTWPLFRMAKSITQI
jgi:hypothetical protein